MRRQLTAAKANPGSPAASRPNKRAASKRAEAMVHTKSWLGAWGLPRRVVTKETQGIRLDLPRWPKEPWEPWGGPRSGVERALWPEKPGRLDTHRGRGPVHGGGCVSSGSLPNWCMSQPGQPKTHPQGRLFVAIVGPRQTLAPATGRAVVGCGLSEAHDSMDFVTFRLRFWSLDSQPPTLNPNPD